MVFPRKIKGLLKEALSIRDQRDAGQITASAAAEAADDLQARTVTLIEPIKTHPANERLASHLRRHRDQLLTFLKGEGIDATNWRAEQALRLAVVNRKVWGGSRTQAGAEAQSILLTISQTARLRAIDPLRWLSQHLRFPDPPPNGRLLANGKARGAKQIRDELYDLASDPHETANRIDDARYRDTAHDMRRRVFTFMEESGYPGPIDFLRTCLDRRVDRQYLKHEDPQPLDAFRVDLHW